MPIRGTGSRTTRRNSSRLHPFQQFTKLSNGTVVRQGAADSQVQPPTYAWAPPEVTFSDDDSAPENADAMDGEVHETTAQATEKKVPQLSADVEFFLYNSTDGAFVPSTGLTQGGAKGSPIWLDKYTGLLEDNAALEINMPPSRDDMAFTRTISKARNSMFAWANSKGLSIKLGNSQKISAELMARNSSLSEFGCSEDFIAYNPAPDYPRKPVSAKILGDRRYAAGHLHLSYDTTDLPPYVVARWLDATIGLDSVFWDMQKERRQFYGLAGLFRPTKYPDGSEGVEYRTLSNLWFFDTFMSERISGAVFYVINSLRKDMERAKAEYAKIPWADVASAINTADEKEASSVQAFVGRASRIVGGCQSNILGSSKERKLSFAVEA